ncbi:MAG TPA: hypothetical protein VMG10_18490 [Gemmataceae bacterium]|nr:hypothetical protein [Gemmataceae bacterium]
MPIALSCSCGRAIRVKDELAGKKIRCPECKSILAVPRKKNEADDLVLEVLPADDEEAPRRAAIQTEAPEVRPPRRRAVEDDEPIPRKRSRPTRDIKRRTPAVTFERGWFGSINAGVAGGILMILIAVVWFIGGLAVGYIFFYPPILLVIGIIAIVKGGLGNN